MKNIKSILLLFTVFAFLLCKPQDKKSIKNNEEIKSISISTFGGEMGYMQRLKITHDSLYYDYNLSVDSTKKRTENKLNANYKLENIISLKQLANFSKILNGKSRQPVDGTDTEIIIKTKQKTYTVINAESSDIWRTVETRLAQIINSEFK
jgi:preprotein translocase subunit YajC